MDKTEKKLPQIRTAYNPDGTRLLMALLLVASGIFSKMVVADNLRVMANRFFSLDKPVRLMLIIGSLAFTFEILADFSALTARWKSAN